MSVSHIDMEVSRVLTKDPRRIHGAPPKSPHGAVHQEAPSAAAVPYLSAKETGNRFRENAARHGLMGDAAVDRAGEITEDAAVLLRHERRGRLVLKIIRRHEIREP